MIIFIIFIKIVLTRNFLSYVVIFGNFMAGNLLGGNFLGRILCRATQCNEGRIIVKMFVQRHFLFTCFNRVSGGGNKADTDGVFHFGYETCLTRQC